MEPINLEGFKIFDIQFMKQSGNMRLVLDLNKNDSDLYAGTLAVARQHHYLFKSSLDPMGIEGENNGHEKEVERVTERPTIYEKFKEKCLAYSGENYYQKLKDYLGVKHLREISTQFEIDENMVADILKIQGHHIDGLMGNHWILDTLELNHTMDSWHKHHEIFNHFNNP